MKTNYACQSAIHTVLRGMLLFLLVHMHATVWAQFSTAPVQPGLCQANICFANPADEAAFERANRCVFGSMCGGQVVKASTQCCGTNRFSGRPEVHDKFQTSENGINALHWWTAYKAECPGMTQSGAPPDALWAQCVVGQKHNPIKDNWNVVIVEKNGSSRDYCIDGCSTPPGVVEFLWSTGIFIFNDKDNPTGKGPGGIGPTSSFFNACAAHDRCYQTCSIGTDQSACDNALLAGMLAACATIPPAHITTFINFAGQPDDENTRDKCTKAANNMHTGLQAAGSPAFKTRRTQYCQCCK
ncbi:MAG: hypothetical protein V4858_18695 [Pseudomonadota bacterium]